MGLAVSLELPLLIIDIQRGGPSTGLPTKTEAGRPAAGMYGRHGESPLPIVAAHSPAHCFDAAIEAARIALKYRTPVILLSDGYLANGSEPWRLPDVDDLPDISVDVRHRAQPHDDDGDEVFWPYLRDPETLARPWADARHARPRCTASAASRRRTAPATSATTPTTTSAWSHLRAAKVAGIADDIPDRSRSTATRRRRAAGPRLGLDVGRHRRRPSTGCGPRAARSPRRTSCTSTRSRRTSARCCAATRRCWCPEMNLGQLSRLRAGRVPRRRPVGHQGAGPAVHRRRARARHPRHARRPAMTDTVDPGHHHARTGRATRRSAGAPAAATTRSSPPCSC